MKRAVIYTRYSTDKQDARSCEDQARRCRDFAAARGLNVVKDYSDAAVSGARTDRASLQALLLDAKPGAFDTVLIDDLSRLSRDHLASGRIVFEDLAAANVRVIDVESGGASDEDSARFIFGVKGLFADQYLQTIRRQTHRGLQGRALAGFHTGGKTYGYSAVEEPNPPQPDHPRKLRVIHPEEAAVVTRIFEMYADGMSVKKIAAQLNADGVAAPHDGGKGFKRSLGWGHTSVRHMLRNENYVGRFVWNQYKYKQIGNRTKRVARPVQEHVVKDLPDLRIIPAPLWERVQQRTGVKRTAKTARTGSGTRPGNLLAGLVRCGVCGGAVGVIARRWKDGQAYTTLGCGVHRSGGATVCANARTVSARKLTKAVVDALQVRLTAPDLARRFTEGVKRRYAVPKPKRLVELERLIEKSESRIKNLVEALAAVGASAVVISQLKAEEVRRDELRVEREGLARSVRPNVVPHPRVIEAFLKNLLGLLEADEPRARELLRRFMPPVVLTPLATGGFAVTGGFDLEATLEDGNSRAYEPLLRASNSRRDRD